MNSKNPPFNNMGVNDTIISNTPLKSLKKSATFDWLTVVTDVFDYEINNGIVELNRSSVQLMNRLLLYLLADRTYDEYEPAYSSMNGYRNTIYVREGVKIFLCGPQNKAGNYTTQINITGEGCIDLVKNKVFYRLIDFFMNNNFNINVTRVDTALDDFYCSELSFKYLYQKIINHEFRSIFRGAPQIIKSAFCESNDETEGMTINFGSPQSLIRLVIYDKNVERKVKADRPSDSPYWVRYEMRFKAERANEIIQEYYALNDEVDFIDFVAEKLNSILTLLIPDEKDSNRSRWEVDPCWIAFIGDIKSNCKMRATKDVTTNIDKFMLWLKKAVSKGMLKIYLAYKDSDVVIDSLLLNWFKEIMFDKFSDIDDKDLSEINEKRKELFCSSISHIDVSAYSKAFIEKISVDMIKDFKHYFNEKEE